MAEQEKKKIAELRLTPFKLRSVTEPGPISDGRNSNGLKNYARRSSKTGKLIQSWEQRVYIKDPETGKTVTERKLGHGVWPDVKLVDARTIAESYQKLADQGIDPRPVKDAKAEEDKTRTPTFTKMAQEFLAEQERLCEKGDIRPATLRASSRMIRKYILPKFVDRPIDAITPEEIEDWVEPIYRDKLNTFRKLWSIIRRIFNRAILRSPLEVNPVNDAVMDSIESAGKNRHEVRHLDSVPYHRVHAALATIQRPAVQPRSVPVHLALQFLIYTGLRPWEIINARYSDLRCKQINSNRDWGEAPRNDTKKNKPVDYEGWEVLDWSEVERGTDKAIVLFVPPEYSKGRKFHRVPLSDSALDVVPEARQTLHATQGGDLLFPSVVNPGLALERTSLVSRCRDLDLGGTAHGFRTSLRIWCAIHGVPETAGELILSHVVGGVMGAYMRSDLLAIRASVMTFWAQYLRGEISDDWEWVSPKAQAEIDALREQVRQLLTMTETLQELVESYRATEARLQRLEAENAALRAALSGGVPVDVDTGPEINSRLGIQSAMVL